MAIGGDPRLTTSFVDYMTTTAVPIQQNWEYTTYTTTTSGTDKIDTRIATLEMRIAALEMQLELEQEKKLEEIQINSLAKLRLYLDNLLKELEKFNNLKNSSVIENIIFLLEEMADNV